MQTHLIIALFFALTVFLAFMEDRIRSQHKVYILTGYALFMILLVTTKDVEHTADAAVYENMFIHYNDPFVSLVTEPSFIYLSKIVLSLGGGIGVMFFLYAVLSIPAKLAIYNRMTPYIFTALVVYIPVYFELHDMIQMRVSAAAMFLLASFIPLSEKKYWTAALLMVGSILFHYSAAVFLPFLFIGNRKLNTAGRVFIATMLPVCLAMYLLKLDWLSFVPTILPAIQYKVEAYKESADKGELDEIYPLFFQLYYLAKCSMLLLCLYYYELLSSKERLAPLLINLFAVSTLFLPSMATIPVIAGRISELFGIVDCLVFTFLLHIVSPPWVARIAITAVSLYMLVFNMLYTEYFT